MAQMGISRLLMERYWIVDTGLDPFRLQVQAYEGGSGRTRTFVFELKSALPPEFYDALWARVSGRNTTRGEALRQRVCHRVCKHLKRLKSHAILFKSSIALAFSICSKPHKRFPE